MLTPPLSRSVLWALVSSLCIGTTVYADAGVSRKDLSADTDVPEHIRYSIPNLSRQQIALPKQSLRKSAMALNANDSCLDYAKMAEQRGVALANYVADLKDVECTYGLFSAQNTIRSKLYTKENYEAVATRLSQEAARYNATTRAAANLILFLRAGLLAADSHKELAPPANFNSQIRPAIDSLLSSQFLLAQNAAAPTTASEVLYLITNLHQYEPYLPRIRQLIASLTNSPNNVNAADQMSHVEAERAFSAILTVYYFAHGHEDAKALFLQDDSYFTALRDFLEKNPRLLDSPNLTFLLKDTAGELFRFMQYPSLRPRVSPIIRDFVRKYQITGKDRILWAPAVRAVRVYDKDNCSFYGTCDYKQKISTAVLVNNYTCSPTIRIRAEEMTQQQMQSTCQTLSTKESYFHEMFPTKRTPVAGDNNNQLEVVVFDNKLNYTLYADLIFDIDVNNGGIYIEGDPSKSESRFFAYEESWDPAKLNIRNLEHEYTHYLDARFNMKGGFQDYKSVTPTAWWMEGVAEYIAKKNDNQPAIDSAKTNKFRLSEIFENSYDMPVWDENRVYDWGYMAVRFMNERHRSDLDSMLSKFRTGDYAGYKKDKEQIGTSYDAEFVSWAQTVSTTGEPPLPRSTPTPPPTPTPTPAPTPTPNLPDCGDRRVLEKGCIVRNLSGDQRQPIYLSIWVPTGAKNLRIQTSGGSGNIDAYLATGYYPDANRFQYKSMQPGNSESFNIPSPVGFAWYSMTLTTSQPISGINAWMTFDN